MSTNKVILRGFVGKDPDIRNTQGGSKIANFSLATSKKWKSKDGTPVSKTDWHKIAVFGKLADIVEKYIKKGSELVVVGELTYNEYEDKSGVKKRDAVVNVEEIDMIGSKTASSQQQDSPSPAASQSNHSAGDEQEEGLPF
jgi:single-strand DNA-binding protein